MEKKNYSNIFKLVWSLMPLCKEELSKIPEGHRVRPYLIFKVNGVYYGFPSTSKAFNKKSRYSNDTVFLGIGSDSKSLIIIEDLYKMPKSNMGDTHRFITLEEENEIVKKILANKEFYNYPDEVIKFLSGIETKVDDGDLVIKNEQLYNVIDRSDNKLLVAPIYRYPVDNSIACQFDGLCYYADIDSMSYQEDDGFEYVSQYFGLSNQLTGVKDKSDINKLKDRFFWIPRVKCNHDFKELKDLEPGMIISYTECNQPYKMIVINNNGNEIEAIYGLDTEQYSRFKHTIVPMDYPINFEVSGVLDDVRYNKFFSKYCNYSSLNELEEGIIFECIKSNGRWPIYLQVIGKDQNGLLVVSEQPGYYSFKEVNRPIKLYDEYQIPFDSKIDFRVVGKVRNRELEILKDNVILSRKMLNK